MKLQDASYWKANYRSVNGNLILTTERIIYEPFIPPKSSWGQHGTKLIFNVSQKLLTRGLRFESFAIELSKLVGVEAAESTAAKGTGAPIRLITTDGAEHRLYVLHRTLWKPIFALDRVDDRDRDARDTALKLLNGAKVAYERRAVRGSQSPSPPPESVGK